MKLNTVMAYKHRANRFAYTVVQDSASLTTVREYFPAGSVPVTFVSASRRTPVIYSDFDWKINDQVSGVIDAAGETVDDQIWFVTFINPVLNGFGYVDGHVYTLGSLPKDISPSG